MASELKIFSIYKIENEDKYYLLQTERPGFSNVSQNDENTAVVFEQNKRSSILKFIATNHEYNQNTCFDFIGEQQGFPIGDKLYDEKGKIELNIYYLETEFGHPWIIIGNAISEAEFLNELSNDDDLLRLKPVGKPKQIKALFITENDLLSSF